MPSKNNSGFRNFFVISIIIITGLFLQVCTASADTEIIKPAKNLSYCPDPHYLQKNVKNLREKSCWKDNYGRNWENESFINPKNNGLPVIDVIFTDNFLYSDTSIDITCVYKYKNGSKTNGMEDKIVIDSFFKLAKQPSGGKWVEAGKDGNKQCPSNDDSLNNIPFTIKDCAFEISSEKVVIAPGFNNPEVDDGCE